MMLLHEKVLCSDPSLGASQLLVVVESHDFLPFEQLTKPLFDIFTFPMKKNVVALDRESLDKRL